MLLAGVEHPWADSGIHSMLAGHATGIVFDHCAEVFEGIL